MSEPTYQIVDAPPRLIIKQYVSGRYIGRICLRRLGSHFLNVVSSSLSEEFQGRGYGKLLYLEAVREASRRGLPMSSDVIVSPSAMGVWRALKGFGVGVVTNPHTEASSDGGRQSTDDNPVYWIA